MSDFALLNEATLPAPPPIVESPKSVKTPRAAKEPKLRRDVTEWEAEAIKCLGPLSYTPASFDKRFAREIQGVQQVTEGQSQQIWRLFKRYRRQITHPDKDAMLAMADQFAATELRTKTTP